MSGRFIPPLQVLLPPALSVIFYCLLCTSAAAQVDNAAIVGQVTIARGNFPPDRIQITLQTRGITVNQIWTDSEGKFIFHDLPGNLYRVSINDEKYEFYEEEVKVDPHVNPTNILSINLKPRPNPAQEKTQVAGANPYLADPAEYEKRFPKKAMQQFKQGVKSKERGKNDDAMRHFQEAVKIAPDFYPAHNDLGAAYLGQSNFAAAEAEFETVLKLNQSDTEAYFDLGNVFLLTQRYDDGLKMVLEGLRRQPNSGFGYFLLGSLYERVGSLSAAETALHDALRFDYSLSRAHLELVNLYLHEKRAPDAIAELKVFLKDFPGDPLAPRARQVLARLQNETHAVSVQQ